MNTTNTDNVDDERIARIMLASAGFYDDDCILREYEDDYYETTEEFMSSIASRIEDFTDMADGRILDTRSYIEPYLNRVLFGEEKS